MKQLQGKVHIKRVFQFPKGGTEFNHIAKRSSLQALKTLDDKPHMSTEITHKLKIRGELEISHFS